MASLYPKQRSPYWYVRYADPLTGKPKDESTRYRRDSTEETRKARQLCAQHTANELAAPRGRRSQQDWAWVDPFIAAHYPNELSRIRAQAAWFNISAFLRLNNVASPRLLTREHCFNYVAWRISDAAAKEGLRKAVRNTALVELQILSAIMRESVYRKKADANPCLQLGMGRKGGKIKPEFTDDQITAIEAKLKAEEGKCPHNTAMQRAWQIAMLHVCRLRETCVPLENVDLKAGTITFFTKGGQEQTKLLHPDLVPLFTRLKAERAKFAYDMPPNWSKVWKYFFKRCGFPDLSFHCIRVTGVNTLRRAGVDQRVTRSYVGHKSTAVHRVYERFRPDDHAPAVKALSRPSSLNAP